MHADKCVSCNCFPIILGLNYTCLCSQHTVQINAQPQIKALFVYRPGKKMLGSILKPVPFCEEICYLREIPTLQFS